MTIDGEMITEACYPANGQSGVCTNNQECHDAHGNSSMCGMYIQDNDNSRNISVMCVDNSTCGSTTTFFNRETKIDCDTTGGIKLALTFGAVIGLAY